MRTVRYYDKDGRVHSIRTEYSFGRYVIWLDDKYYATADDRIELDDAVKALIEYRGYTVKRPTKKRAKKKTSPSATTP